MAERNERAEARAKEAAKHVGLMKGVFASETAATVEAATLYEAGDGRSLELPEAPFEETVTRVTTLFAPAALQQTEGHAALVDPCSFTRPGGNYLSGAFGPEQVICAASNLYPVLEQLKSAYHDANRGYASGQLFTDRALYLPDVVFDRDGTVRRADVIALPEPNLAHARQNNRSEAECDQAISDRIATFLTIAAANGVETLICGAFGCGRQGFPADQVIGIFQQWLAAHPGALKEVVFAVPRAQFDAFDAAFGAEPEPEPQVEAAPEAEDPDDFDVHAIDLPEGVTLR